MIFQSALRICNPLRNHSATWPHGGVLWGFTASVKIGLHTLSAVCAKQVRRMFSSPFKSGHSVRKY